MAGAKTVYREKKYVCGYFLDVYIYPVYSKPGLRSKKAAPTTETQAKLNERHAAEKLTRLLHANFTPGDIELGLDYADNPEDDEAAKRDIQNFIRRLKRLRDKLGLPPLKYISVTEKSSRGRYHHHVTVNGDIDRDVLEKLWKLGRANAKRLQFDENGLEGLAKYIIKSPVFSKRWNASRNLIDPQPKTNDYRIRSRARASELAGDSDDFRKWEKMYPGYLLSEVVPFHNEENGGVYLFARLRRKDGRYIRPALRPQRE